MVRLHSRQEPDQDTQVQKTPIKVEAPTLPTPYPGSENSDQGGGPYTAHSNPWYEPEEKAAGKSPV